jgi:hypothetical protein
VQTLLNRLDTGRWHAVDAADLNNSAAALGPAFNVFGTAQGVVSVPPAYIDFDPSRYLRPFDAPVPDCDRDSPCRDPFLHFNQH